MIYPFRVEYRVAFRDIDMHGVLHHSNYYYYCERARVELLREAGLPYPKVMDMGIGLMLVESKLKYLAPVKFDDTLIINSDVEDLGRTSFRVLYSLFVNETKVSEGYTHHVCVDLKTGKPKRIPKEILLALGVSPIESRN